MKDTRNAAPRPYRPGTAKATEMRLVDGPPRPLRLPVAHGRSARRAWQVNRR